MSSPPRRPGPPAPSGLPAELRARVLEASLGKRPPGRATPAVPPITPWDALDRTGAALGLLLADLSDEQWRLPVLRGLDIQGLMGHLIGVEADVQRALAGDAGVADTDHVGSTQGAAEHHQGEPPASTLQAWRDALSRSLIAFAAADPESPVAMHTMRLRAASLMVARTFELWSHDNDVRRATGRPPSVPDASTLTLMTDLAARGLPIGAARTRLRDAIALRLVLTGPGGGTWTVQLGSEAEAPVEVGLVTDAVAFCRLAANRLDPGDLRVEATGEVSRVADVLAATAALALD